MTDLLWDDEQGARPFDDDCEDTRPRRMFNPMIEGDPWSDVSTNASAPAAGTSRNPTDSATCTSQRSHP